MATGDASLFQSFTPNAPPAPVPFQALQNPNSNEPQDMEPSYQSQHSGEAPTMNQPYHPQNSGNFQAPAQPYQQEHATNDQAMTATNVGSHPNTDTQANLNPPSENNQPLQRSDAQPSQATNHSQEVRPLLFDRNC